jgi:hypothetical protein
MNAELKIKFSKPALNCGFVTCNLTEATKSGREMPFLRCEKMRLKNIFLKKINTHGTFLS